MKPFDSMEKIYIYTVLVFTLFINIGCGGLGFDFTENRTIAIQKSPYVIIVDGDFTKRDLNSVDRILSILSTQPYQESNNSNFDVHINDNTNIIKNDSISNAKVVE